MVSVLIIAAEDILIRNILETEAWTLFAPARRRVRTTLIVPRGRSEELRPRFEAEGVAVREFRRAAPTRGDALLATLLYAGLPTHTNHWSKMRAYYRGEAGLVPSLLKRFHASTLARMHSYQRLLRRIFLRFSDSAAAQMLDGTTPDLVISLSVTNFDSDVVILREAKRRGIRTVGMTRSWDNLTSHGALRVVPDRLIVQNQFLRKAARGVQGIREQDAEIKVIGLPHYDRYADTSLLEPREDFFRRNGLDLKKRLILYCGMGDFLFRREADLIDILEEEIESGHITRAQVLYSVHPKFRTSLERTKGKRHVRPSPEILYTGTGRDPVADLMNLLCHADAVVMGASTMAIDAAVFDRPIICVGFDGTAKPHEIPYWVSVKRFYDSYTHFEELVKTGGVEVVSTKEELVASVNRAFADPALRKEGRRRIVECFVGRVDGRAGERLASILSEEVRNLVS